MMFLDAATTPGATNAVTAVTEVAAQLGAQVTDAFSRQTDQGRELVRQALGWLTQNGVTFALNALGAVLILAVGGLVVKGRLSAGRSLGRSAWTRCCGRSSAASPRRRAGRFSP